jgi:hypothetical protein
MSVGERCVVVEAVAVASLFIQKSKIKRERGEKRQRRSRAGN